MGDVVLSCVTCCGTECKSQLTSITNSDLSSLCTYIYSSLELAVK